MLQLDLREINMGMADKHKIVIFISVVLGLGFFAFPPQAQAAEYYVDQVPGVDCVGNYNIASRNCAGSDGNSYNTIQEALNTAQVSDTVFVRGGEYQEHDLTFAANPLPFIEDNPEYYFKAALTSDLEKGIFSPQSNPGLLHVSESPNALPEITSPAPNSTLTGTT